MQQYKLFPTEVYTDNVLLDISLMVKSLYNTKQIDKGIQVSNKGGWQSTPDIFTKKEFLPLLNYLHNTAFKLFKIPYNVVNMWGNISSKYNYNHIHHHGKNPNSWSGVYYLQTPPNSGDLVLHSFWDTDIIQQFHPKTGDVVLFPSSLSHSVEPNLSNEDRVSISFNLQINQING
tara:strand:+ start:121 stop:645 length:525 start_codon:yes stop_codon:yes gene_type:complete